MRNKTLEFLNSTLRSSKASHSPSNDRLVFNNFPEIKYVERTIQIYCIMTGEDMAEILYIINEGLPRLKLYRVLRRV